MSKDITPLDWKKNPVYISGAITLLLILITIAFFNYSENSNLYIISLIVVFVVGIITFIFYSNQCPFCKRIFCLKKVSDEIIKEWEEPKQYNEKTIYYYSDGITKKDVRNGRTKTFIAKFERHKEGFNCKKCGETHHKTRDVFLNKKDWERVTTPNKVTTSKRKPAEHHTNTGFDIDLFEPTEYKDKSGKRKSIPKTLKMELWKKYNGKNYGGKCFVCKNKIDTHHFEAGHVNPASKGGSDKLSNLRPICFGCNRSMGNMNLYEYKRRYYN